MIIINKELLPLKNYLKVYFSTDNDTARDADNNSPLLRAKLSGRQVKSPILQYLGETQNPKIILEIIL